MTGEYPKLLLVAVGSLTKSGYHGAVQLVRESGDLKGGLLAECSHRHRFARKARDCAASLQVPHK